MTELSIEAIKLLCSKKALRWTNHILLRLLQRNITTDDVLSALQNGKIIEKYPEDYPNPSCLVLGLALNDQYLHIVCGISNDELCLITAYYPNSNEWETNFKTRRKC